MSMAAGSRGPVSRETGTAESLGQADNAAAVPPLVAVPLQVDADAHSVGRG